MSSRDPVWFITVFRDRQDGGDPFSLADRVTSFTYEDSQSKADKLSMSVDNFDLLNFERPFCRTGNRLEVSWGYPGNMSPVRQLTVQKVTGSVVLSVEALSPSVLMHKTLKTRAFEGKRRSEVAAILAEENGYGPERRFIDDTAVVLEQVTQARQSDAGLLRDMARREGFAFFVDWDGFHFHAQKLGQRPLRKFAWYGGSGDMLSFTIENDIFARKAGGVALSGRDPDKKADVRATADNANPNDPLGMITLAPERTIITGISARDGSSTGDHAAESGSQHAALTTETTQAAAQRTASAAYANNQLTAALMTVEAVGDPRLVAKSVVGVENVGKFLSGNYYVKSVTHKVGPGYSMTLKLARTGLSGSGAGVSAKAAVNDARPPAQAPGSSAPGDTTTVKIDRRTGAAVFVEQAGRSNTDAASDPLGIVHQNPNDPLGLISEDAQPDGPR